MEIKFFKSIGTYTLVNIINKGIPFLLLAVLTKYLSKDDIGILTNIESLITLSVILIGINFSSAITRQYFKKEVNLSNYFVTALRIVVISFIGVTIIYTTLIEVIYDYLMIPTEFIYFILIYALLENLSEVLLVFWRMQDKPFFYGAMRIFRTLIEVVISLLLVVSYKYGWLGRFSGIYIAGIATGLFSLIYFIKIGFLKGNYVKSYKNHFLKFGVPLIPHTISGVLIMYSDKIIISKMINIGENGVYSVAFMIGMSVSLIQNSFNQAWVPWLFKKLSLNSLNEKKKLVKITYVYMLIILLISGVLWIITPFIYTMLGSEFIGGTGVVGVIGFGFAFNGMYKMMVNYLFYIEKTEIISIVTIFVAILNITLSVYLIEDYGILGPAYASLITFITQFIVVWFISNKYYPMPWFSFRLKK